MGKRRTSESRSWWCALMLVLLRVSCLSPPARSLRRNARLMMTSNAGGVSVMHLQPGAVPKVRLKLQSTINGAC